MTDSALLLDLYRAARELGTGEFEEAAIAWVKRLLRFDSAIWGTGLMRADGGVVPHVVHLHEQPRESLQEWARLNAADPVAVACMAQPGRPIIFHAPTLFSGKAAAPMRAYAHRFGRQSYMVCGLHHPADTNFLVWLSLYRRNPEAHFTEQERQTYQDVMGHLNEAQEVNRRLQLHRDVEQLEQGEALAIADTWGYLHTPWSDIHALLGAEWSNCKAGRLPQQLLEALTTAADGRYRGRAISVRSRMAGGLLFIRISRRERVDGLTPREQQIAEAIARGLSAKQAARDMGLSPATVRVHLQNIYQKLGLHSQAELAYRVGSAGVGETFCGLR